jgi:hypothetical protein
MKNSKNKVSKVSKVQKTLMNMTKNSQRNERIAACGGAVKATTFVHKSPKDYSRKLKHKENGFSF